MRFVWMLRYSDNVVDMRLLMVLQVSPVQFANVLFAW